MEISRKKYLHNHATKQLKSQLLATTVKTIQETLDSEIESIRDAIATLEVFNVEKEIARVNSALKVIECLDDTMKGIRFGEDSGIDVKVPKCPEHIQTLIDACNENSTTNIKRLSQTMIRMMAFEYSVVLDEQKAKLTEYIGWLTKVNIKDRKRMCKNWIMALQYVEKKFKKVFKTLPHLRFNHSDDVILDDDRALDLNSVNMIKNMDELLNSIDRERKRVYTDSEKRSSLQLISQPSKSSATQSAASASTVNAEISKKKTDKPSQKSLKKPLKINMKPESSKKSKSKKIRKEVKRLSSTEQRREEQQPTVSTTTIMDESNDEMVIDDCCTSSSEEYFSDVSKAEIVNVLFRDDDNVMNFSFPNEDCS